MAGRKTPVVAVASFLGGIFSTVLVNYWTESFKAELELKKLVHQSRSDLWRSTAEHFAQYISNWDRLRLVELGSLDPRDKDCTKKLHGRKADGDANRQKRKERYVEERDKAKDRLMADLEQARSLFSFELRSAVAEFDAFGKKYQIANACELPDASELRAVQSKVLNAMLQDISKGQGSGK